MSTSPDLTAEYCLVLLKPDATELDIGLTVLARLEGAQRGARRRVSKVFEQIPSDVLREHYEHIAQKPFYPSVECYMQSSPVWAEVIEGEPGLIEAVRKELGATDPRKAAPGTIRHTYGRVTDDGAMHNVAHASDSPEAAKAEIRRFFTREEIALKLPALADELFPAEEH